MCFLSLNKSKLSTPCPECLPDREKRNLMHWELGFFSDLPTGENKALRCPNCNCIKSIQTRKPSGKITPSQKSAMARIENILSSESTTVETTDYGTTWFSVTTAGGRGGFFKIGQRGAIKCVSSYCSLTTPEFYTSLFN